MVEYLHITAKLKGCITFLREDDFRYNYCYQNLTSFLNTLTQIPTFIRLVCLHGVWLVLLVEGFGLILALNGSGLTACIT